MKLLFILEYYHPHIGGVERLFKQLTTALVTEGHDVVVLTNRYDTTLANKEIIDGVEIRRYSFYNRYLFTFLAWIPGLWLSRDVDIIHTTSYNAALPSRFVAWIRRKKSVITFHEYWGQLWQELPWMPGSLKRLHASFEWLIGRLKFDRFVAVSHFTHEALQSAGIDEKRIVTIHNGIDYDEPIPQHTVTTDGPFVFLYFGRVSYSKGVDRLLEACSVLKTTTSSWRLIMVVPSEKTLLFRRMVELISDLDLDDHIELRHDLSRTALNLEIASAHCVVIPSYSEGFCFAAVETMAIGTPIISSGRGALPEVINGHHIHAIELTPQYLADAMSAGINNAWSFKKIQKYPLSSSVQQYLDLYQSL